MMKPHIYKFYGKWCCEKKHDTIRYFGTGETPNEAFTNCEKLIKEREANDGK